jgi:hypothetical protein
MGSQGSVRICPNTHSLHAMGYWVWTGLSASQRQELEVTSYMGMSKIVRRINCECVSVCVCVSV